MGEALRYPGAMVAQVASADESNKDNWRRVTIAD
jgi:hypothetical protein